MWAWIDLRLLVMSLWHKHEMRSISIQYLLQNFIVSALRKLQSSKRWDLLVVPRCSLSISLSSTFDETVSHIDVTSNSAQALLSLMDSAVSKYMIRPPSYCSLLPSLLRTTMVDTAPS